MDAAERYKGHERVMAAIPKLVAEGHDVVFVVLGEGNDRARLETIAGEVGVADRVRFVGRSTRETLLEAYRMADLFVMPSTGEGFGIAYLEAMACGTPALGLTVAGAKDALADGELGAIADEKEFSAVLSRMLKKDIPDAGLTANAVRSQFGTPVFAAAAQARLLRLRQ